MADIKYYVHKNNTAQCCKNNWKQKGCSDVRITEKPNLGNA